MKHKIYPLKVISLYLLVMGLFFLQLPLSNSLPGQTDTWYVLSTFEYLYNFLINGCSAEGIGAILYPSNQSVPAGNIPMGYMTIYFPLRYFNIDPIWIFWVIISFVYAFNALGFYLLSSELNIKNKWALIGGLLFSCSNFLLANMDNLDGLFWGWGLVSLSFLICYLKQNRSISILYSSIFIGIQIYFSPYMFFLSTIIIGYLMLFYFLPNYKKYSVRNILFFLITLLIISPYVCFLFNGLCLSDKINFFQYANTDDISLQLIDFFSYLPHNFWSLKSFFIEAQNNYHAKAHAAGIGVITPIIGLYGIYKFNLGKKFWLLFLAIVLLSMSENINLGISKITNPTNFIYEHLGLDNFIRMRIRMHIFFIFCIVLGWTYFLQKAEKELGFKKVVISLTAIAFIENIPIRLRTYPSSEIIATLNAISNFYPLYNKTTLHLPSSIYSNTYPAFNQYTVQQHNAEQELSIEHQYMYLQALTKEKMLNGNNAFITQQRFDNQINILQIHNSQKLKKLISENHLEKIILHKNNIPLFNNGRNIEYYTDALNEFTIVYEDTLIRIYNIP